MTKVVRPEAAAEAEILAEIRWYEAKRVGLGGELWDEIQRIVALLSEHPAIGSVVPHVRAKPAPRRVRLRKFPFYVVYRELENEIQLVALAPMSKRPGYWKNR